MQLSFPLASGDLARQVLGEDYDPARTLNGVIALAAAGELAKPAIALMKAVFACSAADARLREAMILRTASRTHCSYAMHASAQIAKNCGLSSEDVQVLLSSEIVGLDTELALVARLADAIAADGKLPRHIAQASVQKWGLESTRQLILMLSWFNLVNRYENACRVPNDPVSRLKRATGPVPVK